MYAKKNKGTKMVALLVVLMLLIGGAVGGTMAWLVANTDEVVNTFAVGDITIHLTESDSGDNDGNANTNSYKMVPGAKIAKDPMVTVDGGSEACWLFVKVTAENAADFLSYNIRTSEWTQLRDAQGNEIPGVFYKDVAASNSNQEFYVLAGEGDGEYANGYVTVLNTVTKDMMDKLEAGTLSAPELTFQAYAVQKANGDSVFTEQEAWNVAQGLNPDGSDIT